MHKMLLVSLVFALWWQHVPPAPALDEPCAGKQPVVAGQDSGGQPGALPVISDEDDEEDDAAVAGKDGRVLWRKGQTLSTTTDVEDIQPTNDVNLALKQVKAYPDSPEASFILAVALTRTSRVEDALKEVRRARKLAEAQGGHAYFDKMIETYETMLENFPEEDRVRYHLSWAYYMKAYLLAKYSRRNASWKKSNPELARHLDAAAGAQAPESGQAHPAAWEQSPAAAAPAKDASGLGALLSAVGSLSSGALDADKVRIPSALEQADAQDVPEIKKYYELALKHLDDLLGRKPYDVWSIVYRAHLKAEYTGNLGEAMDTWRACKERFPNNPAAYFFLGEGYLRQGNLKESINHVSRAVALRALGN